MMRPIPKGGADVETKGAMTVPSRIPPSIRGVPVPDSNRVSARRGALLPMILAIMVIIALAASAALFTGRQERRSSWNTRLQITALGAADRAHAELLSEVSAVAPALAIGASATRHVPVTDGVDADARLTRLGPTLFLVAADAHARSLQGLSARRRTSLLLRLQPPALGFPAALSVIGAVPPAAGTADGGDDVPPGWPCGATRSDSAPILHPSPPPDTALLSTLRDRAAIRLPGGFVLRGAQPSVRDGACDTARPDNLGDPDRAGPCASWLPVVHASGDLTIDGGVGPGTLIVDGGLTVGSGFRFVGAVIVGGALTVGAGGASLSGGVIAGSVNDDSGSATPAPVVHRSTCAVDAALLAAGALVPVADRPWAIVR